MTSSYFPIAGSVITSLMGITALALPETIGRMLHIQALSSMGLSEVRATYGGLCLGFGLAALHFAEPAIYVALGCGWAVAALSRPLSLLQFSGERGLIIMGMAFESGVAALLFTPLWSS